MFTSSTQRSLILQGVTQDTQRSGFGMKTDEVLYGCLRTVKALKQARVRSTRLPGTWSASFTRRGRRTAGSLCRDLFSFYLYW